MDKVIDKKRIHWIDTAKFFGIYLVILGHIKTDNALFTNIIYSFHMPLFFLLSGLTFHETSIDGTIKKAIKQLLIPYISLYIITYFWWFIASYLRHPELYQRNIIDALIRPFAGMLLGVGSDTNYSIMTNVPLWFLLGLFWCKVFSVITMGIFKKWDVFIVQTLLSLILATIAFFLWKTNKYLPFSLGSAFMIYPFFSMGTLFGDKVLKWKEPKGLAVYALSFLLLCICVMINIFLVKINCRSDVNGINFGKSLLLFYAAALPGIIAVICISFIFPRLSKYCNYLSRNTIVILAFHSITSWCLLAVLKRLLHYSETELSVSVPVAAVVALISLLLCGIPIYIITRFCPIIIGRSTKGNALFPSDRKKNGIREFRNPED